MICTFFFCVYVRDKLSIKYFDLTKIGVIIDIKLDIIYNLRENKLTNS